jgi:hypothetical protein
MAFEGPEHQKPRGLITDLWVFGFVSKTGLFTAAAI